MAADPSIGTTALESLGGLIVICTGWLARSLSGLKSEQQGHGEKLARIETVLTGADGTNGLNGDVKSLRERSHKHSDEIHTIRGQQQVYELKLGELERRVGEPDRRHA